MCPVDVGVFHHAGYMRRDRSQILAKMKKHSHVGEYMNEDWIRNVLLQEYEHVSNESLPRNILAGDWPESFFWDDLQMLVDHLMPNEG